MSTRPNSNSAVIVPGWCAQVKVPEEGEDAGPRDKPRLRHFAVKIKWAASVNITDIEQYMKCAWACLLTLRTIFTDMEVMPDEHIDTPAWPKVAYVLHNTDASMQLLAQYIMERAWPRGCPMRCVVVPFAAKPVVVCRKLQG